MTTSEGVVRGSLSAPVQWPIEQTSAAGEWCAVGGLTQVLEAGQCVEVWADYKAMVGEFAKGKRALLDGEFRCGGIGRHAARQLGYEGIKCLVKVKAHQNVGDLAEGAARLLAVGNNAADTVAKRANGRHLAHPVEQVAAF